uniref:C2H2-type domain-containing protein n=1 Tax=Cacopsylla melanoneura TaxID=428564 RepID=A0A8D9DSZ5_9HEMI
MNDSNLSEFLLDINTGIAYKVVELNGINYLCNISNVCNVLDITSLGEDNQYDSVILNVSNPANSHSLQLSSNIITFDSNNQNESNRGIIGVSEAEHVAEEIDTELDEIISFVQEDISHDKKIIESFGKLPPVTGVTDAGEDLYNQSYEESTSSCSRIVPECIALENTHAVPECINEVLVISIHNTNYVLDNRDNVVACSLQDEECQFKDKEEARERMKLDDETRETMEVDDESCDETRIQKKIKVKLKPSSGAAQWGHCLDTVDENQVTLETREQIMTSVEKKMAVRKKRDCTNLVEFNTNKDKLTVFICNICNAVFDQMSKYHGHMRKHTEQVMWKCRQCPPDESSSATFRTQSHTHISFSLS